MTGSRAEPVVITYADLCAMPDDGKRYELFEGDLIVTPSPTDDHQHMVTKLAAALDPYVTAQSLGRVRVSPLDCVLSETDVVQPDLIFIARERLGIIRGVVRGAPDLCVEIASPATAGRDRQVKRRLYARHGVRHYWIVDPAARTLTELVRKGAAYRTARVWTGEEDFRPTLFPGLTISLPGIWP